MTKKFEEFLVYNLTMELTKNIFLLLEHPRLKYEFELSNQMKRAVLSISNNIAEGSEYNSNAQFVRFLRYAKGSCGEVRNILNVCEEIYGIDTQKLKSDCKNISIQLFKFIEYLTSTKK